MKHSLKYIAILALVLCTRTAFGQTGFSETVMSYAPNGNNSGNDFWFAPIQNYIDSDTTKYIRIYISAIVSTIAYIELNGQTASVKVPAYNGTDSSSVASFDVPLAWELKSSGIVENKGIHVWSPSANLSVYLISHVAYSGDGFYCIPTQDLGTDYVVAGYESLFEGFGTYVYDLPSEFTITATHDSTTVEITPACDLRQATIYPENNDEVVYPQGRKFTVTLNRGQAVQYQTVKAQDADNYDVTGTILHSNNSVGLVAGSMGSNIPPDFPYEDFLADMIPPVQSWGETYYVTSTEQPQGMTGHNSALYDIISSVPNQTIYRMDCNTGIHTEAQLGPKYDHYYLEEEYGNKFFSDQPFMLVQYLNSATYPDDITGNGDPAEVVINPVENFTKTVLFQAPASVGVQSPFDNYANVIVNVKDAESGNVKFDGMDIRAYSHPCIDNLYTIYEVPHIHSGAHEVTSESGIGVYLYGYGFDESYAWAGSLGRRFLNSTDTINDTIAPKIVFSQDSICLHILLSDSISGLSEIAPDSMSGVSFSVDTNFSSGNMHSFADLCVLDPLKNGYLQLFVTDIAGNTSVATITYTHPPIVSAPGFTFTSPGFDTVLFGTEKTLPLLTITDTSTQYPITINRIWTLAPEFIFDGGLTANKLPLTISPLASHNFIVTFNPGRDSAYAAPFFAVSDAAGDQPTTIQRVDTLTGIGYSVAGVADEPRTEVRVTLTPNPAAKSVSLNFSLSQTANVTFELSSMDGKNVFRWNADVQSEGEHLQTIDISSITQGDYIYRFAANGEVTSGKLAILH